MKAHTLATWLLAVGLASVLTPVVRAEPMENTVIAWLEQADKHQEAGEHAAAERLYQRVLAEAPRLWGKDSTHYASVLNNLAELYRAMGRHAQAEPLYRRCLEIYETRLGKDHPDVALPLNNLALLYLAMGRYEQAEPLSSRCLEIRAARLPNNHPLVAQSLHNLALLYRAMGRYEQAEPLYRRCLEICKARLGENHPDVATCFNNLANLYADLGRYEQAVALHRRSLEIRETRLGKDHPVVAHSLHNLATLYCNVGRYEQAEPLYRRCLEIKQARLDKDHPEVALSFNNLANLYKVMGRHAEAEPLYRRCLEIYEAKLGKDHPLVADSLHNLAILYWNVGRHAEAEPLYRRCLEIKEAKLGKDHPDVALALHNLALLYASQDKPKAAAEHCDRARRIIRQHTGRVLPLLSEREQLDFFQRKDTGNFYRALSLGYRHAADAGLAARSAAWLLNAKGLAQQTRGLALLAPRDSGDAITGEAMRQLLEVRRRLARLVLNPPTPNREEAHRREQQWLTLHEQELVKHLQRQGAAVEAADPWVEIRQFQAALRPDAVFIDLARLEVYDFKATRKEQYWGPARYVAWVTAKEGPVRVIDLGEADKIDAAVSKVRHALDEAPKQLQEAGGEIEAEKAARQALADLAALVLQPLRQHIDGAQRWVICPDGNLWLAPWAALPLDDKTYAAEKHTLQLVVSGRDLVAARAPGDTAAAPAVFADPDFDRAPEGASRLAGKTCPGRIGKWPMIFVFAANGTLRIYDGDEKRALVGQGLWKLSGDDIILRTLISVFTGKLSDGRASGTRARRNDDNSVSRDPWEFRLPPEEASEPGQTRALGDLKLGQVPRLPGTAVEAEVVAEGLHKLFEVAPLLRTKEKATTAAFRDLRCPRALVLATHGFFLPDQEISAEERERLARNPEAKLRQQIEDPLLRCGLLLAGCNKPSGGDTGVLTGKEVLSADLRGCEMVVLSACETGLGDVHVGEGVAGLRQAFQLAGASSVLASLWKVPDDETALLMAALMDGLGQGQDRAAALAEAQRRRIAARRDKFGAAHPYYWAAFSLTGDAGKGQR